MIRCVIFDFDGTLRQSVAIKHEAYFAAVRDIERGDELFREIIREFPTMTRYSGCALFAERRARLGWIVLTVKNLRRDIPVPVKTRLPPVLKCLGRLHSSTGCRRALWIASLYRVRLRRRFAKR